MNRLIEDIRSIFFPKTIFEKYRHIGYSYPGVPNGWKNIVNNMIIDIEKQMWPQKYLPLFVKRLIHYLATGNTVVRVKYDSFDKLRKYLTKNQMVIDIKDKYAELRVYGYFSQEVEEIVNTAIKECENTCESCGSKENVEIFGKYWIYNLCEKCRDNENDNKKR